MSLFDRPRPWGCKEYAAWRGITEAAAAQERFKGTGPRFIKTGSRVHYDPQDVWDWLDNNKIARTDQKPTRVA